MEYSRNMSIIVQDSLGKLRTKLKGKKLVFCSGVFDLTHAGHVLFFEDAKKYGDILVVGVGSDALIHSYKGPTRPIQNEYIRLKMIDSLKPIDYVFLQIIKDPQNMVEEFLTFTFEKLRPDVYVINEDASEIPKRKAITEKYGIKLKILPRSCPPEFENISTTNIINKIKKLP
jgi:rfaE bifunctional protein nucleotidyltransferase chain/domain